MECRSRALSTWSYVCECDICRLRAFRTRKLNRAGKMPNIPMERVVKRLRYWTEVELWTSSAVASAVGVPSQTACGWIRRMRTQPDFKLGPATRAAILNAGPPTAGLIDVTICRRQLRALAVIAYSIEDLAEETGVDVSTLRTTRTDRLRRIRPSVAASVDAAYQRLHMKVGPSPNAARMAIERRWYAPAAWNDIRDRNEKPSNPQVRRDGDLPVDMIAVEKALAGWRDPVTHEPVHLTIREKRQAVAIGVLRGMTLKAIGVAASCEAYRYLHRYETATPATTQLYAVFTRAGWSHHDELREAC